MPMTKKHFEAIADAFKTQAADALNNGGDNGGADIWLRLRSSMADVCAGDCPRFDRERFYRACDPNDLNEPE